MDRRAGKGAGNLRQGFHPLLLAHVSGVKGDHSALRQVQFLAQGTRRRSDRRCVDPIGKQQTALGGDTLLGQSPYHGWCDAADALEAPQQAGFDSQRRTAQSAAGDDAQGEGGVDLEILDMEQGARAGQPGRQPRPRGRNQGRRDGDQNLGAEGARSPQGHRQAADGEARQMDQPAQAPGPGRNIKRATIDLDPLDDFAAPTP